MSWYGDQSSVVIMVINLPSFAIFKLCLQSRTNSQWWWWWEWQRWWQWFWGDQFYFIYNPQTLHLLLLSSKSARLEDQQQEWKDSHRVSFLQTPNELSWWKIRTQELLGLFRNTNNWRRTRNLSLEGGTCPTTRENTHLSLLHKISVFTFTFIDAGEHKYRPVCFQERSTPATAFVRVCMAPSHLSGKIYIIMHS